MEKKWYTNDWAAIFMLAAAFAASAVANYYYHGGHIVW